MGRDRGQGRDPGGAEAGLNFGNYILKSLRRYGFVPISITMMLGLACSPVCRASTVFIPAAFNAASNALAAGARVGTSPVGTRMVTPILGATGMPAGGSPTASPVGGKRFQFAASNALSIDTHKPHASGTLLATIPQNFWPAKGVSACEIAAICFAESWREAKRVSNSIILDCCSLLIRSSMTNREIVHIDSTATPTTTNHVATRWSASEYLGASRRMPAPTATPANTLPDNKTKWGQNASSVPDHNPLKYAAIVAILTWVGVAGIAGTKLIQALIALRRH